MHPVRTMVLTQKRVPRGLCGALYASAGIVVSLLALLAAAVFVIDLAALSTEGPGMLEVHRWTAAALTLAAATWLVVVTSNTRRRRARSGGRPACVPRGRAVKRSFVRSFALADGADLAAAQSKQITRLTGGRARIAAAVTVINPIPPCHRRPQAIVDRGRSIVLPSRV